MWNSGTSVRHFLFLGYPSLTSSLLNVMPLKMNEHMKLQYVPKFYKEFSELPESGKPSSKSRDHTK